MEIGFLHSMLDKLADNMPLLLAFVFISSCLQQWFPPYPGDSVMLLCGMVSGHQWNVGLPLFAVYFAGTLISSALVYELGMRRGKKVLNSKIIQKWFPPQKQTSTIEKLQKYHVSAFLFCKFLPGCNSAALLLGGAGHMKRKEVYFAAGMAAFLHNTLYFCFGKKMSDNSEQLARVLRQYSVASWSVLLAIIVIYIVIKNLRKYRIKDKK